MKNVRVPSDVSPPRRTSDRTPFMIPPVSQKFLVALLLLAALHAGSVRGADTNSNLQIIDPLKINAGTLKALQDAQQRQQAAAKAWKVFHDFQFSDRYAESGIT